MVGFRLILSSPYGGWRPPTHQRLMDLEELLRTQRHFGPVAVDRPGSSPSALVHTYQDIFKPQKQSSCCTYNYFYLHLYPGFLL